MPGNKALSAAKQFASLISARNVLSLNLVCFHSPSACAENNRNPITNSGQTLTRQGCYGCHGYHGTGRYPLAGDVSGIMTNKDLFITFLRLRADINPINPSNSMPNYSKSMIDDNEAQLLYDYINTFEDNPPKLEDIPVLREILESATVGGKLLSKKELNGNQEIGGTSIGSGYQRLNIMIGCPPTEFIVSY